MSRRRSPSHRWPALLALTGALSLAVVTDREREPEPARLGAEIEIVPTVARASASRSIWYCPAAAFQATDEAPEGFLIVTNAGDETRSGEAVLFAPDGANVKVPLKIAPRAPLVIRVREHLAVPVVAAAVDLDGGDVFVEHRAHSRLGEVNAPCSTRGSSEWYFAEGSTSRSSQEQIVVFNPFPEDATVDLAFIGPPPVEGAPEVSPNPQGGAFEQPVDLQSISVPSGTVAVFDLGANFVRRRPALSAKVTARPGGRIVVERIQVRTEDRTGITVGLGAVAPSRFWYYPHGLLVEGMSERFELVNPGDVETRVDIAFTPDDGSVLAEPIQVTLPARTRHTVVVDPERVSLGVGHFARVTAEQPVVVERIMGFNGAFEMRGASGGLGCQITARRWLGVAGPTHAVEDDVVVGNAGSKPARVRVNDLTRPEVETLAFEIGPGKRHLFDIDEHFGGAGPIIQVESDQLVSVEHVRGIAGGTGVASWCLFPRR